MAELSLDDLASFVRVLERGGFSSAAATAPPNGVITAAGTAAPGSGAAATAAPTVAGR